MRVNSPMLLIPLHSIGRNAIAIADIPPERSHTVASPPLHHERLPGASATTAPT